MWDRYIKNISGIIFRLVGHFFPPTSGQLPSDPRLILVFSTTGIGDSLFDTAAIRSLKVSYPQARIIVCAHRKRETIARHHPDVAEVIPYGKSPRYFFSLVYRFRRERPDLVVLLNINEEVVPIAYCINRHALVGGIERCERFAHLLSHGISTPEGGHILHQSLAIVEAIGGEKNAGKMIYHSTQQEKKMLEERFPEWISKPFVVFQTGGGRTYSWRDWPAASYIRTIKWLTQITDLKIILTGGWDNEAAACEIEGVCPEVINLCCKTSLEETAALLGLCSMLVSTDTGVMHLGYAVGCSSLSILHYKNPRSKVGPLDVSDAHEVVELPIPSDKNAPFIGAMKGISDEAVKEAITRLLIRSGIVLRMSKSLSL